MQQRRWTVLADDLRRQVVEADQLARALVAEQLRHVALDRACALGSSRCRPAPAQVPGLRLSAPGNESREPIASWHVLAYRDEALPHAASYAVASAMPSKRRVGTQ